MSKKNESKLDQFSQKLEQWLTPKKLGGDGITQGQAITRLSELGCSVSAGALSDWWKNFQREKEEKQLLKDIFRTGENLNKVEDALKKAKVPDVAGLMNLLRVVSFQLTTKGNTNPDYLHLADRLLNTVLRFTDGQTKAAFKERELNQSERKLTLMEKKAAAFDEAKGILGNKKLSESEKRQRMEELFGR